jgi:hypothetical protein
MSAVIQWERKRVWRSRFSYARARAGLTLSFSAASTFAMGGLSSSKRRTGGGDQ